MTMMIKQTNFDEWKVPGYTHVPGAFHSTKVLIGFDVEYELNTTIKGKNGEIIHQRDWKDIISIQLSFNYENNHPVKLFLHREHDDPCFSLYHDVFLPLKQYLTSIKCDNGKSALKTIQDTMVKMPTRNPTFKVEMWGFWLGVDISAFTDYVKILTEDGNDSTPSNLVTIGGNTVFTGRPLKLIPRDSQRHLWELYPGSNLRLVLRDMTKLAPAKSNLAALGDMLGVPKLDTEQWDVAASHKVGYFKEHMTKLWEKWPDRYEDYAMTDTVITVLYGSFILNFMQELNDEGLSAFTAVELKSSLSAIVSHIVKRKNKRPIQWINDIVLETLILKSQYQGFDANNIEGLLHSLFRRAKKDEHFTNDCEVLLDILKTAASLAELGEDRYLQASNWIADHLDFDKVRKGYTFPTIDVIKGSNHRPQAHDKKLKQDLTHAKGLFERAADCTHGGFNLVTEPGIIPVGTVKSDCDLKSAYNTSGHLSPDVAIGLGIMHSFGPLSSSQFHQVINYAETLNGPYTVGDGVFKIVYPKDYHGFITTPQNINDGPRYLRIANNVPLTFTDAYTAWSCGASVETLYVKFPYQAKMDPITMQGVSNEGKVQDIFQQRRTTYAKTDPRAVMCKQLGNSVFGATFQGAKEHKSTDFNQNKAYLLPFSEITNPWKSMQYTAITRYHITLLQKAIHKVNPKAHFVNNVTDGMLVDSSQPLDTDAINHEMDKLANHWYRDAVQTHFKGIYFESKDTSSEDVANLRTRMTFSRDGSEENHLHAMVGVPSKVITPEKVFKKYLDKGAIKFVIEKHVISNFVNMKNDTKWRLYETSYYGNSNAMKHYSSFKYLQHASDQPTDIFLGYDFACWPINYKSTGKFTRWQTDYYDDVNEFNHLWPIGRLLIKYAPMYTSAYAPYFKTTFDQLSANGDTKVPMLGEFLNDDDKKSRRGNELYLNYCHYLAQHHITGNRDNYQKIVDTLDQLGWPYVYGRNNQVPTLDSFKRFIKKHFNDKTNVPNLLLLKRFGLIK